MTPCAAHLTAATQRQHWVLGPPFVALRRLEHEGIEGAFTSATLWAPRGTFSTEKTVNQALQPSC